MLTVPPEAPPPDATVILEDDLLDERGLDVVATAGTHCVVVNEVVGRGRGLGVAMRTPAGQVIVADPGVVYIPIGAGAFRARGRFADLPILCRGSGRR